MNQMSIAWLHRFENSQHGSLRSPEFSGSDCQGRCGYDFWQNRKAENLIPKKQRLAQVDNSISTPSDGPSYRLVKSS